MSNPRRHGLSADAVALRVLVFLLGSTLAGANGCTSSSPASTPSASSSQSSTGLGIAASTGSLAGTGGASSSTGGYPADVQASASTVQSSSSGSGGSRGSNTDAGCTGGPTGAACTDSCDQAAIAAHEATIQPDVYTCTLLTAGASNPACIAQDDGLSTPCADCWAQLGSCGARMCAALCGTGDVDAAGCNACLATRCDCAFTACSGIVRPAGADAGVDAACD